MKPFGLSGEPETRIYTAEGDEDFVIGELNYAKRLDSHIVISRMMKIMGNITIRINITFYFLKLLFCRNSLTKALALIRFFSLDHLSSPCVSLCSCGITSGFGRRLERVQLSGGGQCRVSGTFVQPRPVLVLPLLYIQLPVWVGK